MKIYLEETCNVHLIWEFHSMKVIYLKKNIYFTHKMNDDVVHLVKINFFVTELQ